jgi:hypothetical protein
VAAAVLAAMIVVAFAWELLTRQHAAQPVERRSEQAEATPVEVQPGENTGRPTASIPAAPELPPCAGGQHPSRPLTGERLEPDVSTSGHSEFTVIDNFYADAVVNLALRGRRKMFGSAGIPSLGVRVHFVIDR